MTRVSTLPVMESFHTIQGEGTYTGHAAWFIRLAGCDVGCVWCDVKESWEADRHPQLPIGTIVSDAAASRAPIAVITGGEPAMHNLSELTTALKSVGMRTHIETSGAHALTGTWDWVCLSPKKFKAPVETAWKQADELKVIVYHPSDLDWAVRQAAAVKDACRLFLQPEWSRAAEMTPLIVGFVKANPRWQVSLQTHKYMNIP